ncbi:MAG: terpene cyclase/mutase family protein [Planctomycetota bacterium]|nr:terpene cyclase/mutase family protein [Planctomycetota bacterium]
MNAHRGASIAVALIALALLGGPTEAGPRKPKEGQVGVPDKELQKRIDKAVEKGADWLREQQERTGRIGHVKHGATMHYKVGSTALAGLALLAAGDKRGDKAVDAAMKFCEQWQPDPSAPGKKRRTVPVSTYDTGTLLMFAVEYYKQKGAKKKLKKKRTGTKKDFGDPCKLPPDVLAWIKDMAQFLVRKQKESGDWGYPDSRPDNSNTQYALLGLRAARECGGIVPGRVFIKVIERMLAAQEQEGPKVQRFGVRYDRGDRARGWSYLDSPYMATGSMTTAGIACLAISHYALLHPRKLPIYKPSLQGKVSRAIQDGFAWLDLNFTVARNPPGGAPAWHYYYLYGLERAAILAGRERVGKHDWYLTGARYLVGAQKKDGRWSTGTLPEYQASDILDTAWAILFLKKATKGPPIAVVATPSAAPSK